MYCLETVGTTFSAVYFFRRGYSLNTYGEVVFILLQNAIILSQIVVYENFPRMRAVAVAAVYGCVVALLLSSLAPLKMLMTLQVAAIPILNFARIPQILLNYRRKSTGELSPVTLGLQVIGNIARVFTTLASVGDMLMLLAVLVSTTFNSALVGQYWYYNHFRPKKTRLT